MASFEFRPTLFVIILSSSQMLDSFIKIDSLIDSFDLIFIRLHTTLMDLRLIGVPTDDTLTPHHTL